ncbi:hypothetical protein N2152v2_010522 [Parachlorella kessleri]
MADQRPPAAPQTGPFALPASMLPFMSTMAQSFGAMTPQMQQQLLQSHVLLTQQQMQQLQQQQGGLRPPASGAFPALPIPLTALPVPATNIVPQAGGAGAVPAPAGAVGAAAAAAAAGKPATSLPLPQPLSGVEGGSAGTVGTAAGGEESMQELPPAEATHEQVISDETLFMNTLMHVHLALGIVEKVPIMNSRPLDLPLLYRTVTAKGGMEEVIQRKAWKEVSNEFNFPETITSASFQLRKAYVALLWDYEQVYYKRKTGPRVPPPPGSYKTSATKASASTDATPKTGAGRGRKRKEPGAGAGTPGGEGVAAQAPIEYQGLPPAAPTALTAHATQPGAAEAAMVGSRGEVVVDAKFDCGYFITGKEGEKGHRAVWATPPSDRGCNNVHLGGHEFHGMLYFPPAEHTRDAFALPPLPSSASGARKGPRQQDDPYLPRQAKSAFNFFAADARGKAKALHPAYSQNELSKKLGEMWTAASEAEKAPYLELAAQDKRRYNAELEAYNYRLATNASLRSAHEAAAAVSMAQSTLAAQALQVGGQLLAPAVAQQAQQQQQAHDEAMQDAESGDLAADAAEHSQHVLPTVANPLAYPIPGLPAGAVPIVLQGADPTTGQGTAGRHEAGVVPAQQ